MEKFMMIRDRKGTVHKLYHGDEIYASINDTDIEDEDARVWVTGKLCLNDDVSKHEHDGFHRGWICQDKQLGCDEAQDKFGYAYSWTFSVSEHGKIESGDTYAVLPIQEKDKLAEPVVCHPCTEHRFNADPLASEEYMPEDWVMPDVIPSNL